MPFDFEQAPHREGTNSVKWDVAKGELPMWVADMDFAVAPVIKQALQQRLDQDAYGYNEIPASFGQTIANWWQKRHQLKLDPAWVLFSAGVIPSISSTVRKLTHPGDNVVVLTPVYNIFYNSIRNNQRQILTSELSYQDGAYKIDFADLEEKLARANTSLMIFCNPHNPIGKVWDRATLTRVGELCLRYHVVLLSDEIHCDLTHPGHDYVPMLSLTPAIAANTIMCVSATKAFNIAGIQTSAIVIPDPRLRQLVDRQINTDEVAEPNTFAIQALEAAFNEGGPWLDALNQYLAGNRRLLQDFLAEKVPEVSLIPSEATYLAWLDCQQICQDSEELAHAIRQETGLFLTAGEVYGGNGAQFLRWNYACPRARLQDGLNRFAQAVENYRGE
ncbi:MalY/PatB family protein [Lapidilactobacillus luobeiensis]|uniref:MalY/PatB family protein n=1 Tax=Lapidilactobacillus luobeiensis TaxID=2950371 RepID=UPI0021C3F631|nr:MalY/PatB family protein [Lapidilactobacillus luobeiensis]